MKKKFATILALLLLCVTSGFTQIKVETTDPDLSIKVSRCSCNGGTLSADLIFTNYTPNERSFTFVGPGQRNCRTTAYDDEGNQYTHNITMGRIGESQSNWFDFTLPTEVPIKLRLQIKGINELASKLMLLQIGLEIYNSMGRRVDPIKIHNIEWSK